MEVVKTIVVLLGVLISFSAGVTSIPIAVAALISAIGRYLGDGKRMYKIGEEIDYSPAEVAASAFFLPSMGIFAAVLSGVGINLVTESSPSVFRASTGILLVGLAILITVNASRSALYQVAHPLRGGLTRWRKFYYAIYHPKRQLSPTEIRDIRQRLRTANLIRERYASRASRYGLSDWLREHINNRILLLLAFVDAAAAPMMFFTEMNELLLAGFFGGTALALAATMFLEVFNRRRLYRFVETELAEKTSSAWRAVSAAEKRIETGSSAIPAAPSNSAYKPDFMLTCGDTIAVRVRFPRKSDRGNHQSR